MIGMYDFINVQVTTASPVFVLPALLRHLRRVNQNQYLLSSSRSTAANTTCTTCLSFLSPNLACSAFTNSHTKMVSFPPPSSSDGYAIPFNNMNSTGFLPSIAASISPNSCRRCHHVGCDVRLMDCGCLFHAVRAFTVGVRDREFSHESHLIFSCKKIAMTSIPGLDHDGISPRCHLTSNQISSNLCRIDVHTSSL